MPFTRQQPAGGVQPDPTAARHIHFGPGVQIGEIDLRAAGAIERLDIRSQLNEIARHKPRSHPQMPQHIHHQPRAVTAGTAPQRQGFFRRLNPRLQPNQIFHRMLDDLIHRNQIIDRSDLGFAGRIHERRQPGRRRRGLQVRGQFAGQNRVIGERAFLGVFFEEKIERIHHRQLGDKIHFDREFACLLGEHQPCQAIAVGILLPVDEIIVWRDRKTVGQDGRTAVGCRAQP